METEIALKVNTTTIQFYDATNKRAICQEIDRLCDSDDTSYPRLDKTARVNDSLEELVGEIISADGIWEWDDTNQTDMPSGTLTLVQGQQLYTFASEYLKIKRLKILDVNSKWQPLRQIDSQDLDQINITIENYFGTDSSNNPVTGMPKYYDIIGDSFRLYPAPTSTYVTLAAGLKVEFVRTTTFFTAVSTTVADTKEPGLPSPYHIVLPYMASLPYCAIYKKDRVAWLEKRIGSTDRRSPVYGGIKLNLIKFYTQRNPDRRNIMSMRRSNRYSGYYYYY